MPLYVYRCKTCGRSGIEELQKLGDAAPSQPSDAEQCPQVAAAGAPPPCELERELTSAGHRFSAEYSSDGLGGYERQGDMMIRQRPGKSGENYGSDKAGHS